MRVGRTAVSDAECRLRKLLRDGLLRRQSGMYVHQRVRSSHSMRIYKLSHGHDHSVFILRIRMHGR